MKFWIGFALVLLATVIGLMIWDSDYIITKQSEWNDWGER